MEREEKNITKAVRTIYMDLMKTFHPDREPNLAEKERKTAIIQRITQAYEQNNLLLLLKLRMEFNHIDAEHLEKLSYKQLLYLNKVL